MLYGCAGSTPVVRMPFLTTQFAWQRRGALPPDHGPLAVSALHSPGRVAGDRSARRHVMRHDASGADNRVVADGDAREDDGAAADPDVTPDPDGSAAFEPLAPLRQIARMIGRVDLDGWTDLRPIPDGDLDHIEDHAIEVEERVRPQANVEAIVAMERRADDGALSDLAEAFGEQCAPLAASERYNSP